jgi:hypothetical protein
LHNGPSRLGKCLLQDLQQFVGIGFKRERDSEENVVNIFDFDNGEVKELEKLPVGCSTMSLQ